MLLALFATDPHEGCGCADEDGEDGVSDPVQRVGGAFAVSLGTDGMECAGDNEAFVVLVVGAWERRGRGGGGGERDSESDGRDERRTWIEGTGRRQRAPL